MGRVYLGSIYKYKLQDKVLEKKLKKMKKRLDLYTLLFVRSSMNNERLTNLIKGKKSYE